MQETTFLGTICLIMVALGSTQSSKPCTSRIPKDWSRPLNISDTCQNKSIFYCNENSDYDMGNTLGNRKFPVIPNINELLSPLSKQNCFVVLDNFHNINLPRPEYPLVLRRLELIKQIWKTGKRFKRLWMPAGAIPHGALIGISLLSNDELPSTSKYYKAGGPLDKGVRIDHLAYSGISKPWSCQVMLRLYPPGLQSALENSHEPGLPFIFSFENYHMSASSMFPEETVKNVPLVNLILFHRQQITFTFSQSIRFWANYENANARTELTTSLLVEIMDGTIKTKGGRELIDIEGYVKSAAIIKIAFTPSQQKGHEFKVVPLPTSNFLQSMETLTWMAFHLTRIHVTWALTIDIPLFIRQRLAACQLATLNSRKHVFPQNVLKFGVLQVWKSIFINHTYQLPGSTYYCSHSNSYSTRIKQEYKFLLKLKVEQFVNIHSTYAYSDMLLDDVATIRFVTCGERGLEGVAYHELLGVFHWHFWALLSLVGIAVQVWALQLVQLRTLRFGKPGQITRTLIYKLDQFGGTFSQQCKFSWDKVTCFPRMLKKCINCGWFLLHIS